MGCVDDGDDGGGEGGGDDGCVVTSISEISPSPFPSPCSDPGPSPGPCALTGVRAEEWPKAAGLGLDPEPGLGLRPGEVTRWLGACWEEGAPVVGVVGVVYMAWLVKAGVKRGSVCQERVSSSGLVQKGVVSSGCGLNM